jgi:hypothetical protein
MDARGSLILARALALSLEMLEAAEQACVPSLKSLDAQRLQLLQSARLERDNLTADDWRVLKEVCDLNDRTIGLMEHHQRIKVRALDMAAVGRRAVVAYSSTLLRR